MENAGVTVLASLYCVISEFQHFIYSAHKQKKKNNNNKFRLSSAHEQ